MHAGLPSWHELATSMIAACDRHGLDPSTKAELSDLTQQGSLDDVLEYCRDFMGEGVYRDFLSQVFESSSVKSTIHQLVMQLPTTATFSTNYDRLLETSHVEAHGSLPTVLTNHDVTSLWRRASRREPFILKVHGDITRPETVVLTGRDYTQHIFGNLPFMQFLQRTLMSSSVLFLGTSLSDDYLRRILEEVAVLTGGLGMQHYAIMNQRLRPGSSGNVSM